jgi:hypothetical protein
MEHKKIIDAVGKHILAQEISARVQTVQQWRQRNKIPFRYWHRVLKSTNSRGISITFDDLERGE